MVAFNEEEGAGSLNELLYILSVPMASMVALAAFQTWWSAALYFSSLGLAMVVASGVMKSMNDLKPTMIGCPPNEWKRLENS
jgi:sugar phosphate permease